MTDANDIRAWAADHGYQVSTRGRIPASVADAYSAAHPGANGHAPDYPDGMTGDDFTDLADPFGDGPAETRPKQPAKPAGKGWKIRRPGGTKGKRSRGKPKHPRLPVDDLICAAWRALARVAAPVPPLQRTLRVQAPVAGLLLEDSVKGTVVDTVLQPIARLQNQGKAAAALAGPPLLVTAITVHSQKALMAGNQPNPVFLGMATEMLRESLMLWMEVAGPKFEEALKREKEFEERYGGDVDDMIAFLLSPPVNPADEEQVKAEEDAIKRAQGIL